jgi:hypothetical protein
MTKPMQHTTIRATHILILAVAALASIALAQPVGAAADPYGRQPAVGDTVRFDGSAGGEKMAWAYPTLNYLEAFLRGTINAALTSTTYDQYKDKMSLVLAHSLTLDNGTQAVVQGVQRFYYRDHEDVEVQARITSGALKHAVVWTTPAELVDSSGHKYLK